MGSCHHLYGSEHAPCPHPAAGDGELCIWHNPAVAKSDDYVAEVLAHADELAKGDLAEFHLAGLVWAKAALPLRNLRAVDLRDAFLDGADLGGADLGGANLRRASLKRADLRGARLVGCDLTDTNLSGADLRDADLSGAILSDTVLLASDLRGANLAGARVTDFRWNRLSRFAGVKGLEAGEARGDGDETQTFLTPLALGDHEVSALAETEPALVKTRVFSPLPTSTSTVMAPPPDLSLIRPGASVPPPSPAPGRARRWPLAVAAALALAVGGGGGIAATRLLVHRQPAGAPAPVPVDLAHHAADQQHEADLVEIRQLQAHERALGDDLAAAKQEAAVRRAEAEQLRTSLHESENDLVRLRSADDRATVLALKVAELQKLNGELARQSARQDELSRILADGVARLQQDNQRVTAERDQHLIDEKRTRQLDAEATQARAELAMLKQERDSLQGQNQKLLGDLLTAQRDIERYLARVNATHLQDYLTEDDHKAPLLPVTAGSPMALSGDYLLTMRIEHGTQPGTVQCQVVAQRPPSATNPEVTVVLYDQEQRPLRRLAYSFPHVDDGRPFVFSTTTVACDRFPAFARVLVAPGLDDLAARK
jgi:hypothetical protein